MRTNEILAIFLTVKSQVLGMYKVHAIVHGCGPVYEPKWPQVSNKLNQTGKITKYTKRARAIQTLKYMSHVKAEK